MQTIRLSELVDNHYIYWLVITHHSLTITKWQCECLNLLTKSLNLLSNCNIIINIIIIIIMIINVIIIPIEIYDNHHNYNDLV